MGMTSDEALKPEELAGLARARAAFNSFLNVHFTTLPDAAFVKRMRKGELASVLEALVKDGTVEPDIAAGASMMSAYLEKTRDENLDKMVETLGVDRTRLYRGVAVGYGPPPPNEMEWKKKEKKEKGVGVLVAISGFYREMGLEPSPNVKERLDYISVEMDFMHELALREADAWESGSTENAKKMLKSQQTFLSDHLGQWVPAFITKAQEYVETDFYKGHMLMLRGFIKAQTEELASLTDLVDQDGESSKADS